MASTEERRDFSGALFLCVTPEATNILTRTLFTESPVHSVVLCCSVSRMHALLSKSYYSRGLSHPCNCKVHFLPVPFGMGERAFAKGFKSCSSRQHHPIDRFVSPQVRSVQTLALA
jgi:hypothetical protein